MDTPIWVKTYKNFYVYRVDTTKVALGHVYSNTEVRKWVAALICKGMLPGMKRRVVTICQTGAEARALIELQVQMGMHNE